MLHCAIGEAFKERMTDTSVSWTLAEKLHFLFGSTEMLFERTDIG